MESIAPLPLSLLEDAGDVDDRCAVGTKSTMETQRNPQAAGEQQRRRKAHEEEG